MDRPDSDCCLPNYTQDRQHHVHLCLVGVDCPNDTAMHRRFWDFGLVQAVKDMFADPKFRSAFEKGRNYTDPGSYFSSAALRKS